MESISGVVVPAEYVWPAPGGICFSELHFSSLTAQGVQTAHRQHFWPDLRRLFLMQNHSGPVNGH
jgi:hypothetical protein